MSKRQAIYAVVGYIGAVWSVAVLGSGKPFDALVMVVMAMLLLHISYEKEKL